MTREQIEEAVAKFFDEGECTHAPVICGVTIRNDPAHCSACLTDFTLEMVKRQMIPPHTCPVCAGTGKVSRPPWIAGDVQKWVDSTMALYDCQACQGTGILWEPTV